MGGGITYKKATQSNYKDYLDSAATDLDNNVSDTWYLQGNYDTAATAATPDQLEAVQNGGITNYNISDPSINSEKTYSFDEAMGEVKTDDIKMDTTGHQTGQLVSSIVGGAGAIAGGILGGILGPIGMGIGMGVSGLASIASSGLGKGVSNMEKKYNKDIEERKADVKRAWATDALKGNNDDYYITGAKTDEDGNYVSGGTIRAKQKQVVLTGYGSRGVRSSGIGM